MWAPGSLVLRWNQLEFTLELRIAMILLRKDPRPLVITWNHRLHFTLRFSRKSVRLQRFFKKRRGDI